MKRDWKKLYEHRMNRIAEFYKTDSPATRIAPLMMTEFQMAREAHYGGFWKTIRHDLRCWWFHYWRGKRYSFSLWLTVKIGWTKWQHHPATSQYIEYDQIHASDCSPNCRNHGCHTKHIPKWFRKIFGWEKDD